jgi:hypothetical protein
MTLRRLNMRIHYRLIVLLVAATAGVAVAQGAPQPGKSLRPPA